MFFWPQAFQLNITEVERALGLAHRLKHEFQDFKEPEPKPWLQRIPTKFKASLSKFHQPEFGQNLNNIR